MPSRRWTSCAPAPARSSIRSSCRSSSGSSGGNSPTSPDERDRLLELNDRLVDREEGLLAMAAEIVRRGLQFLVSLLEFIECDVHVPASAGLGLGGRLKHREREQAQDRG